jgi:cytochrome P450
LQTPTPSGFDRDASSITFGFGVHRCLGVLLAEREIQYALEEMLTTLPPFRLADGFRVPFRIGSVIQAPSLEIVWH